MLKSLNIMPSKKLQRLFLISLVLVYLHGLEEILTGFQYQDSSIAFSANLLGVHPEIFYWVTHIIFWVSLPILYFIFRNNKYGLVLAGIFGLIFIEEFHHLIKGALSLQYSPGMLSALFYPILGIFFWKQLIKDWRTSKHAQERATQSKL